MNRLLLFLLLASLTLFTRPALAVFKLTETVEKLFNEAETVLVATVTEVRTDGDNQVVLADVKDAPRGKPAADKLRLVVKKPELHFKALDKGHPVVIFAGKASGSRGAVVVHAGDKWVMATAVGGPQTWTPYKDNPALGLAFPGRTTTLVKLLDEYKAGKSHFLNAVEDRVFTGGVKALGKLPVQAVTQLLAVDLDGDKNAELIAATGGRLRILKRSGESFADVTDAWGPEVVGAGRAAAGDINGDGKPDLLAGGSALLNEGAKFKTLRVGLVPEASLVACALLDATGDHKPDALFVDRIGGLGVYENTDPGWKLRPTRSLWKQDDRASAAAIGPFAEDASPAVIVARGSGLTRYSLTPGSPPDDFTRFTGDSLQKYLTSTSGKLKNPTLTPIDPNGDGRTDLLLTADGFAMVLFNRGHGAFFASTAGGAPLLPAEGQPAPPFKLSATTCFASADLQADKHPDLLVLTDDGALYLLPNPPPAP